MKLLRAAVAVDDDGLAGKGTGRGGRERDGARGSGDRSTLDQRAHCREAGFVDALRDQVGTIALAARRRTEARGPAPGGSGAVGHRHQRELGRIVVEREPAFNGGYSEGADAVGKATEATEGGAVGEKG